jgi:plastocyanin
MKNVLHRSLLVALVVLSFVAVVSLPACSGGYGASNPTTSSTPVSANSVTLANFAFSPTTITVKVGTAVTWTNKDGTTHTVSSDTGAFDSGNLAPGGKYSYTFSTAGTYGYHCSIHSYMKGTVIVQ